MQIVSIIFLLNIFIIEKEVMPFPPRNVNAFDYPDDRGGKTIIDWNRSITDSIGFENNVWGYRVFRVNEEIGDTIFLGFVDRWRPMEFIDTLSIDGIVYRYLIQTKSSTGSSKFSVSEFVSSSSSIIYTGRLKIGFAIVIFVIIFFIWDKKTKKENMLRINYKERIDWSIEKGKPIMIVFNNEDRFLGKNIKRNLNDLRWVVNTVVEADGKIKILAPGYLIKSVVSIVRNVYMKKNKLDHFNPLSIRRVWSEGVSFSEESCRLIHLWKPGVVFIMGENRQWMFPAVNAAIDEKSEILGWNLDKLYAPAGLIGEIGFVNITGNLSFLFYSNEILRKSLILISGIIFFAILMIFIVWLFSGNTNIENINIFMEEINSLYNTR